MAILEVKIHQLTIGGKEISVAIVPASLSLAGMGPLRRECRVIQVEPGIDRRCIEARMTVTFDRMREDLLEVVALCAQQQPPRLQAPRRRGLVDEMPWNGRTLRIINNCLRGFFLMHREGSTETLKLVRTERICRPVEERPRNCGAARARPRRFSGHVSSGLRHWWQGKGKRRVK